MPVFPRESSRCCWRMFFGGRLEAYVGGPWYMRDAHHNQPRFGRILMARGRDAVDVALTTSFGPANLTRFTVGTDEVASFASQPAA